MAILRSVALLLVVVVALGACTTNDPAPASTTSTTTTVLAVAIRTTAESTVVVAEGVDPATADALGAEIAELRSTAETLRGLGFIGAPPIAIETPAGFTARWEATFESSLDAPGLAIDTRLMRLLGLVGPGDNLRAIIMQNVPPPVVAFYDGATGELVVSAASASFDAIGRAEVVRQLVRALTDQYHDHTTRVAALEAGGDGDGATALATLALADALYAELRYIDSLSGEDQQTIAQQGVAVASGPSVVVQEMAFVGDAGVAFVGRLLESGGTAELDVAYGAGLTTESILHPDRFMAGEGVLELATPQADVSGYAVQYRGTRGELGLNTILGMSVSPGVLTQTTDGWGADHEIVIYDNDDVAFGYVYRGDGTDDTVEVAQAFLDHAAFVMGMNEPRAAGGGVEFVGLAADTGEAEEGSPAAGPYVFVDRTGDLLYVVVASDPATGRELRAQLLP